MKTSEIKNKLIALRLRLANEDFNTLYEIFIEENDLDYENNSINEKIDALLKSGEIK